MKMTKFTSLVVSCGFVGTTIVIGESALAEANETKTLISSVLISAQQTSEFAELDPKNMTARRRQRFSYANSSRKSRYSRGRSSRNSRYNRRRSSYRGRCSMPSKMAPGKKIVVSLCCHKLGAYNSKGQLVKTCPISGGAKYCPDVRRACRSPRGSFRIHTKKRMHYSSRYPVQRSLPRAAMPHSMFFHGGYAVHATTSYIRGQHESHGCIRTTRSCAAWLFNWAPVGTRFIVKPYCGN